MKKTLIVLISLAACASASAQSMYDAYTFGENNYIGSAKSLGLSNAVTALGGDLGTIGINPAGSAVAGYSQFTISPGLSLSIGRTVYSPYTEGSPINPIQTSFNPRFKMPNLGMSARYETEGEFLRSFTFAFVLNSVSDFNSRMESAGFNKMSSRFAEMAAAATDLSISPAELASNNFYDNAAYSNYWDVALGYDLGLINSYGTGNKYVGCSEVLNDRGEHYIPSELLQKSTVTHLGYKNDMICNFGFNFRDRLFLGFNFGMPLLQYTNVENFSEVAQTVEDFPVSFTYTDGSTEDTYFSDAAYRYNYYAKATGIYAKLGLIWLPTNSLRLGLAYQTRTMFSVEESWQHSGMVHYDNGKRYSGSGEEGWYNYTFYSPSILNAGIAWTFGHKGLLSVDYEMMDYTRMKFQTYDGEEDEYAFDNAAMKAFSGMSHNIRLGVELNLTQSFAIRGGASFRTSPERHYFQGGTTITYADYDDDYFLGRKQLPSQKLTYPEDSILGGSMGFGFNPAGSFFADFAFQGTLYPATVYKPYYDYSNLRAPEIRSRRLLCAAVVTLGWRF